MTGDRFYVITYDDGASDVMRQGADGVALMATDGTFYGVRSIPWRFTAREITA